MIHCERPEYWGWMVVSTAILIAGVGTILAAIGIRLWRDS